MALLLPTEADHDDATHDHATMSRGLGLSRRAVLSSSLALAALPWAGAALAQNAPAGPTRSDALGPFYPTGFTLDEDADLTTVPGRKDRASGPLLYLSGRVLDRRGAPVAGAILDLWQCNAAGRYIHAGDDNPAPLDPAFVGFGRLRTDAEGRYAVKTIKPGEYGRRTPHIHFDVSGKRSRLITQMYFEGERLNATDGLLNRSPEGQATKMSRWVAPSGSQEKDALVATWDVVLAFG